MRTTKLTLAFTFVLAFLAFGCSSALASEAGWWHLSTTMAPTYIAPGGEATILVRAVNRGDVGIASESSPITIADQLPKGLVPVKVSPSVGADHEFGEEGHGEPVCRPLPAVSCTLSDPRTLQPYEPFEVAVTVKAEPGAESGANVASIEGGESRRCLPAGGAGGFVNIACSAKREGISETHTGAYEGVPDGPVAPVSSTRTLLVKEGAVPFGLTEYGLGFENEDGSPDTQAGSHPFQFTTSLALNETDSLLNAPATPKDLHFDLPAGFIGNATVLPQCDESDFSNILGQQQNINTCPADTVVGVAEVRIAFRLGFTAQERPFTFSVPLFNLVPAPGEPARFGFEVESTPVTIDIGVRTGRDYAIVANVTNITQQVSFLSSNVTLWGVPGDPRHDSARGWNCVNDNAWDNEFASCVPQKQVQPPLFLTMPSSCTGELQTEVQSDAWDGTIGSAPLSQAPLQSMHGCSKLPFAAGIEVAPDVQEASKPTGLNVHVHIPQEASGNAEGLAGSDVQNMTVALPPGVTLNAAGADGLQACSEEQAGFEGANGIDGFEETIPGIKTPLFTAGLPEPLNPGLNLGSEGFCPDASKIGTAKITLPVITHPLLGSVYLATPAPNGELGNNPFNSLVSMYIIAEDPVSGVLVKLPGDVSLCQSAGEVLDGLSCQASGQIITTFEDTPQAPFEDAELHFFGGDRAPLSTPALCGTYATEARIAPWSGSPPVSTSASFQILTGPGGSACTYPGQALPFSPSLTAGSTSNSAGGFSPFTMTMSREDGQQNLKAVTLHMPPGLSGILTGIPLCGEAQADAGTCSAASLIGETTVSVGLGSNPYTVTGGKVYLTGGYEGAPFGLSIVNPANAGPFHLGNVIVRAKIEVNPITAALTITSDTSGPYAIPPSIKGIPLQIKHINVTVNRPGFTFNPTNCSPQSLTGTLSSIEGATATLPVSFQSTNCAALKFAPKFAVSTPGKTTKAIGAGLHVKLSYPAAAFGSQANVARVKVDLPKQLPSQLKTLQKACPAKTFEEGFEKCLQTAPHSKIGEAIVHTPLLPVPLKGPAIFVSHGGEAFPSLTIVLQGYGVTVDLVGSTFIHGGVTSTTFKTVPDLPFSTFELTLSQGQYAALNTNLPEKDHGNLCGQKLAMPTAFVSQTGQELHQSTPISVSGCGKTKKTSKKKKKPKQGAAKKRGGSR